MAGYRDILQLLSDIPRAANIGYSTLFGNRTPLTEAQRDVLRRLGVLDEEEEQQSMAAPSLVASRTTPRYTPGTSEYVVPFEKERPAIAERFASGGTFNVPKMTPDWAPKSEEDQLSSIYTTSALQQLVTNRPVDPRYGDAVASLRNAGTLERQRVDLAPGRQVEADAARYLLDLSRSGKLGTNEGVNAAIKLVDVTRDQMTGAPDPAVSGRAMDLILSALGKSSAPVDSDGPSLDQPGASVGIPTERIGSGNSQWKFTVTGPDGDLWFSNDGTNWTNSRGVTRRGRLQ